MSDPEVTPGMSSQAIADLAISRLNASPEPDAGGDDGATDPPDNQPGDDAPDASPPSVEDAPQADPEPVAPSVEPPASWTKAEKEAFATLPPAHQQAIADRERERTKTYRQGQDEAAAARKEREAIAAERQQTADKLKFIIQQAQLVDPVLAEGQRTDWAKLAQDNPAEYVAKKAAYDQRIAHLNYLQAETDRLDTQNLETARTQMVEALRGDEELGLKDQAKWESFNRDVTQYLLAQGASPQRIARATAAPEIKLAWKAMMYDRGIAEKKAIEAKKQAPAPKRTIAPGAADEGRAASPRLEAAERAAIKSGNPRRMAEVAMARLRASPNP